jgi:hypothetical protein
MNRTQTSTPPSAVLRASMLFAFCAFAVGFALGTVRVLFVTPRVGELGAVLIEAPLMIVASWLIYRRLVSFLRLNLGWVLAGLLGLRAFIYLQFFEVALFVFMFKRPLGEYTQSFNTPQGQVGLAAQIAFALMPLAHCLMTKKAPKVV